MCLCGGLAALPVSEVATTNGAVGDLAHVREAVDAWVASKRYLEPDISVDEVARQMGVGRQAVSEYFNTVLQKPFRTWRIEQRIGEAERLLSADPTIATGELCTRCGYRDRSNFHKHFLKVAGRSLAEYRETLSNSSVLPGGASTGGKQEWK